MGFDPAAIEAQNQDMANAQNAHYVALRNKAIQERDLMVGVLPANSCFCVRRAPRCCVEALSPGDEAHPYFAFVSQGQAFTASKQAYAAGDGEEAHNLSVQGKTHQRNRDQLNAEAAQWIFNGGSAVARLLRLIGLPFGNIVELLR